MDFVLDLKIQKKIHLQSGYIFQFSKTERPIYNFLKIPDEIEAAAICFSMERGRRKSQQNSRICVRAQIKLVYPV